MGCTASLYVCEIEGKQMRLHCHQAVNRPLQRYFCLSLENVFPENVKLFVICILK